MASSAYSNADSVIPHTKISRDIGVPESLVSEWVSHAVPYPDDSGYQVHFKDDTPCDVKSIFPRMAPANFLIVLAT